MSPSFLLLLLIPALPFAAGLLVRNLQGSGAGRLATGFAALATVLTGAAAILLLRHGAETAHGLALAALAPFELSLRLDGIALTMSLLVTFLGTVVLQFSRRYLAGDPGQARFFSWMSLTLSAVLLVVLSSNLLLLWMAWVATSLCLHRLLLFYPGRAGAVFAARKKFIISRIADLCLLGAIILLYQSFGTLDFDRIFAQVEAGTSVSLTLPGLLLVACAALKSAQFPFHSWLPDTMETPTPVSAFMHAGIINAGGFLIVRLSPLLVRAPGALNLLAVIGALTAAFGAVVMLPQPSVKRALAFSTIAQMGFMMLQCGLGAFGLALVHIVAHSLYKAHAFLHAGSTIGAVPRATQSLRTPALALGLIVGGFLVAGSATLIQLLNPQFVQHLDVFGLILMLALAYGMARAWSVSSRLRTILRAVTAAAGIALLSLALHGSAQTFFAGLPVHTPPVAIVTATGIIFGGLFGFQVLLWRAGRHPLGRTLYVHALNGFYVSTAANRLLNRLWPRKING
jgi:NAD(P)H-quinone oxidoreductase subunit 5